jgi:hypothetical protein
MTGLTTEGVMMEQSRELLRELDQPHDTWASKMVRLLFLEDELNKENNIWRKVCSFFNIENSAFSF